jgi:hypothetical protein
LATALAAEAMSGGGPRGPSPGRAPEPAEALLTLPAASTAKDLDEGGAEGEEPQRQEIYLVELHFEPVVLHVNISIQALCDEPDLQEFHPTNKLSGAVRQLQDVTLLLEGVCHALYFYVGGVLATPAAVKVDNPMQPLASLSRHRHRYTTPRSRSS